VCKMFNSHKAYSHATKLALSVLFCSSLLIGCGQANQSDSNQSTSTDKSSEQMTSSPVKKQELPQNSFNSGKPFNIGQTATKEVIAGWDIDVRPDGLGLPIGSGSVEDGEELYEQKCALCHGSFGEGVKRWPKLSGGQGTLSEDKPEKTVGSYWPYASTLWDYIYRAMPFPAPQSLETDEVYAITAYVLNLNDIVDDEFVLTQDNFATIQMPNKDGFYVDDRPDATNVRCMSDCLDPEKIKQVASLRGISPTDHFKNDGNTGVAYKEDAHDNSLPKGSDIDVDAEAKQTYETACKVCHSAGLAGAPKFGVASDWEARIKLGTENIYKNSLNGLNGMPPKGGRADLADETIKAAVDYMLKMSQAK